MIAALLGVATGLWLRASAVLALTVAVAVAAAAIDLWAGETLGPALLHALAAVVLLQLGYLAGLLVATAWRRRSR
ncbi:hypothetical protein NVS89_02505 [Ancylobacter sp. MQZ15Z-1]|uniref:Uncharacterized protein n=1 Tax=Ancylobacter mangrovi TaxID=2972472 RepID=A0A9X2PE54_9HYPH|nr:hypothetical protein [Ancylobacter mangrovi]MCS0493952.1 hypothetical protein [Ancylobacter mangrovi]